MKKYCVGFLVGVMLLGTPGISIAAETASLSQIVELFIALGIISPDKAANARAAVGAMGGAAAPVSGVTVSTSTTNSSNNTTQSSPAVVTTDPKDPFAGNGGPQRFCAGDGDSFMGLSWTFTDLDWYGGVSPRSKTGGGIGGRESSCTRTQDYYTTAYTVVGEGIKFDVSGSVRKGGIEGIPENTKVQSVKVKYFDGQSNVEIPVTIDESVWHTSSWKTQFTVTPRTLGSHKVSVEFTDTRGVTMSQDLNVYANSATPQITIGQGSAKVWGKSGFDRDQRGGLVSVPFSDTIALDHSADGKYLLGPLSWVINASDGRFIKSVIISIKDKNGAVIGSQSYSPRTVRFNTTFGWGDGNSTHPLGFTGSHTIYPGDYQLVVRIENNAGSVKTEAQPFTVTAKPKHPVLTKFKATCDILGWSAQTNSPYTLDYVADVTVNGYVACHNDRDVKLEVAASSEVKIKSQRLFIRTKGSKAADYEIVPSSAVGAQTSALSGTASLSSMAGGDSSVSGDIVYELTLDDGSANGLKYVFNKTLTSSGVPDAKTDTGLFRGGISVEGSTFVSGIDSIKIGSTANVPKGKVSKSYTIGLYTPTNASRYIPISTWSLDVNGEASFAKTREVFARGSVDTIDPATHWQLKNWGLPINGTFYLEVAYTDGTSDRVMAASPIEIIKAGVAPTGPGIMLGSSPAGGDVCPKWYYFSSGTAKCIWTCDAGKHFVRNGQTNSCTCATGYVLSGSSCVAQEVPVAKGSTPAARLSFVPHLVTQGNSVSITGSYVDTDGDLYKATIRNLGTGNKDGDMGTFPSIGAAGDLISGSSASLARSFTIPTETPLGTYWFRTEVVDTKGNTKIIWDSVTVTPGPSYGRPPVDTESAPTAILNVSPSNVAPGSLVTITGSYTDADANLYKATIRNLGTGDKGSDMSGFSPIGLAGDSITGSSATLTRTFTIPTGTPNGAYWFRTEASDNTGKTFVTWKSVNVSKLSSAVIPQNTTTVVNTNPIPAPGNITAVSNPQPSQNATVNPAPTSASITVPVSRGAYSSPSTEGSAPVASLSVSPSNVAPGSSVTITGSYSDADANLFKATIRTLGTGNKDKDMGTFPSIDGAGNDIAGSGGSSATLTRTFTIPAGTPDGAYWFRTEAVDTKNGISIAWTAIVVQTPSVTPPAQQPESGASTGQSGSTSSDKTTPISSNLASITLTGPDSFTSQDSFPRWFALPVIRNTSSVQQMYTTKGYVVAADGKVLNSNGGYTTGLSANSSGGTSFDIVIADTISNLTPGEYTVVAEVHAGQSAYTSLLTRVTKKVTLTGAAAVPVIHMLLGVDRNDSGISYFKPGAEVEVILWSDTGTEGHSSDSPLKIVRRELYDNGQKVAEVSKTSGASENLKYIPASDGTHVLVVKNVTAGGVVSSSQPKLIMVGSQQNGNDVSAPTLQVSPKGTVAPGTAVTVTVTTPVTYASVELNANGVRIGELNGATSPYRFTWTPVVAGTYVLSATTYPRITTSNGVTVTVGTATSGSTSGSTSVSTPPAAACPTVLTRSLNGGTRTGTCYCESVTGSTQVWGSNPYYTDDSYLCAAAKHAGATIPGNITYMTSAGRSSYTGSTQNGITSKTQSGASGSFTISTVR